MAAAAAAAAAAAHSLRDFSLRVNLSYYVLSSYIRSPCVSLPSPFPPIFRLSLSLSFSFSYPFLSFVKDMHGVPIETSSFSLPILHECAYPLSWFGILQPRI